MGRSRQQVTHCGGGGQKDNDWGEDEQCNDRCEGHRVLWSGSWRWWCWLWGWWGVGDCGWGGVDIPSCFRSFEFQDHNPAGWCLQPRWCWHMISCGSCFWGQRELHICPRRNSMVSESASSPGLWKQVTWYLRNVPMYISRKPEQNKLPPPGWQEMWSAFFEHQGGWSQDERSLAFTNEEVQKLLI